MAGQLVIFSVFRFTKKWPADLSGHTGVTSVGEGSQVQVENISGYFGHSKGLWYFMAQSAFFKAASLWASREIMQVSYHPKSFLADWIIKVIVDSAYSDLKPVNAGVQQGFLLSVTLFLLHINHMLRTNNIHHYAEDGTSDALYSRLSGISGNASKIAEISLYLSKFDHIYSHKDTALLVYCKKDTLCRIGNLGVNILYNVQYDSLALRGNMDSLCVLYRIYHGKCLG